MSAICLSGRNACPFLWCGLLRFFIATLSLQMMTFQRLKERMHHSGITDCLRDDA
jgi:hypothetical protein